MPKVPTITWIGGNERIIDAGPAVGMMKRWPGGSLHIEDQAEHEILMEKPEVRQAFVKAAVDLFARHT
jgi:lysophospholipase